ncbi:RING-type E3 ubiquitin transferase [Ranunculus cassubicifolius]
MENDVIMSKLQMLYDSLPRFLMNLKPLSSSDPVSDEASSKIDPITDLAARLRIDDYIEEHAKTKMYTSPRESYTEEEEIELLESHFGCRQFVQFVIFNDEVVEFLRQDEKHRRFPDMRFWFDQTVRWISQQLVDENLVTNVGEEVVKEKLIRLFMDVGDTFYCYLCKSDVKPIGEYPSITCPICGGWMLVEASPYVHKIPDLPKLELLVSRFIPSSRPKLTSDSMISYDTDHFQCLICLEELDSGAIKLSCGHLYCHTCIVTWFDRQRDDRQRDIRSCPTCSCLLLTVDSIYNIHLKSLHFQKNR